MKTDATASGASDTNTARTPGWSSESDGRQVAPTTGARRTAWSTADAVHANAAPRTPNARPSGSMSATLTSAPITGTAAGQPKRESTCQIAVSSTTAPEPTIDGQSSTASSAASSRVGAASPGAVQATIGSAI